LTKLTVVLLSMLIFSYILFLIFLGGILVLFIAIKIYNKIATDEMFKFFRPAKNFFLLYRLVDFYLLFFLFYPCFGANTLYLMFINTTEVKLSRFYDPLSSIVLTTASIYISLVFPSFFFMLDSIHKSSSVILH
ncbi:hypothetical protein L9F63_025369, partial [Diploptera punctata]